MNLKYEENIQKLNEEIQNLETKNKEILKFKQQYEIIKESKGDDNGRI